MGALDGYALPSQFPVPIESTFGTIRHRTKRSKGCLTRESMLHMIFKLSECAEKKLAKATWI